VVVIQSPQAEELATLLMQNSHNSCSTKKAAAILDLVGTDGDTAKDAATMLVFLGCPLEETVASDASLSLRTVLTLR